MPMYTSTRFDCITRPCTAMNPEKLSTLITSGTNAFQVISAPISQYDVENGRSACTCICLEATISILGAFGDGVWAGTSEDVSVSSRDYLR